MEKFKYTADEIKVMKNFATINPNMVVLPDKFAVINGAKKSVVGYYNFDKSYSYEPYGIFDLNEFLTLISVADDYQLEVNDRYVEVFYPTTNSGTKYNLCAQDLLPQVGEIGEKFAKLDVEYDFDLSADKLATLKKVTNILQLERIYFQSFPDINKILLTATNKSLENSTNPHIVEVDGKDGSITTNTLGPDTILYVNVDELKILDGDYKIEISSKGISRWSNQFMNLQYYIGVNTLETE